MIVIIDYGMGNLASVVNAVKRYTNDVEISSDAKRIADADKLILPGVGAFKDAYYEIEKRGLREPVLDFLGSGRHFLGICLGLQLLFTKSHEDGEHKGFGVIKGEVMLFPAGKGLKVPHMGWNTVTEYQKPCPGDKQMKVEKCPLLRGVAEGAHMYFVHSYYVVPQDRTLIAATTDYGLSFCSLIQKGNIYAAQFHPEKSQSQGLRIIENFVRL